MRTLEIKAEDYRDYGECIRIRNNNIELIVTVAMGPRIIHYGFVDGENMLYESDDWASGMAEDQWHIIGGHRLWHSPEKYPRTWLPDWEAVPYRIEEDCLVLECRNEEWVQLQKIIRIRFNEDDSVSIEHSIVNHNAWLVKVSAWAITAMVPGGTMIVKQANRRDDFAYSYDGGRLVSLWPYTNMNDSRVYWGNRYITLEHNAEVSGSFKFGVDNVYGWAAYHVKDMLFIKTHDHKKDVLYPDNGVSYESYTDASMLEMETLSPIVELKPDESVTHVEQWWLYNSETSLLESEAEIKRILKGKIPNED